MRRLVAAWVLTIAVANLVGCAAGAARRETDPGTRWVLIRNIRYSAQGSEPEYVWVREDEIPTSLTTVFFGKKAVIAPPYVVPRYAPPPGNGVISPLQGGPYAGGRDFLPEDEARPADVPPPAARPPGSVPSAARSPASGGMSSTTPGLTPRGYVVYVDAGRVVVDLTARHGLKPGDIVRVTREKIPVVHPVTGAYLGEVDEEIATARIVELRERFAIGEIREVKPGAEIRIKDRVVPQP